MPRREILNVWVAGVPKPKGSVKTFVPTKGGEPVRRGEAGDGSIVVNVTDDNKGTRSWMKAIRTVVAREMRGRSAGLALEVECVCFLRRPDGHYGSGRNAHLVKDLAPAYPIAERSGDVDKLARCVLDALNEVAWQTDAAVQRLVIEKRYAVPSGRDDGMGAVIAVYVAERQIAQDLPVEERMRALPARERPADDAGQLALGAA